jgi:alkylhydroperoxidase family enzyme
MATIERAPTPLRRSGSHCRGADPSADLYERSSLFDDKDKAAILYADRLTRAAGAGLRDGALEELKRHFNEDQIVELALVVCMANFTNRFNNGLRLEPDLG